MKQQIWLLLRTATLAFGFHAVLLLLGLPYRGGVVDGATIVAWWMMFSIGAGTLRQIRRDVEADDNDAAGA